MAGGLDRGSIAKAREESKATPQEWAFYRTCDKMLRGLDFSATFYSYGEPVFWLVLASYPYLERKDILQALRYAARLADEREVVLAGA